MFPVLAWRLQNDRGETADCFVEVTETWSYQIVVRKGDAIAFSALAIDFDAAQRMIDARRVELADAGWTPWIPARDAG